MKARRITKVFCLLFCVLIVFLSFPFVISVSAATQMDGSNVLTDLKEMGIDYTVYKKDVEDKNAKIIQFLEFAYDYNGRQDDYGLYLYIYNPTGEDIVKTSEYNTVQLYTKNSAGGVSSFGKCKLICVSYSTEEEYKYLFYKFKIDLPTGFLSSLSQAQRHYRIVDLELQYLDEANPRMSKIANEYLCNGFQPYRGQNPKSDHSNYYCISETIETISIDIHPATWKTISSDKGANYQYEVSSVYFAIPNYYLEKYGNMADPEFRGLEEVHGEYYEYKINGLITDSSVLYYEAENYLGELVEYDSYGEGVGNHMYAFDRSIPFYFASYDQHLAAPYKVKGYNHRFNDSYHIFDDVYGLHNVFHYTGSYFEEISTDELYNSIYSMGSSLYSYKFVDQGYIYGWNDYKIKSSDKELNSQIASYASNHNDFVTWLSGNGKLNEDKGGYSPIFPIVMIEDEDVDAKYSDEAIGENLFICEGDVDGLQDFYKEAIKDDRTTYLMRFAVRDYYFDQVDVYQYDFDSSFEDKTGDKFDGEHYFFEKTIFHNFDILDFTFKNAEGEFTKVPVSSKPISIVGNVSTNVPNDNSPPVPRPTGCDKFNDLNNWIKLAIFFAGLILVLLFWNPLSKLAHLVGKIISAPFKGAAKLVNAARNASDRRRDRKDHDEDREYKRQDYEYKSKDDKRKESEERRKDDKNRRDEEIHSSRKKESKQRLKNMKAGEKERKAQKAKSDQHKKLTEDFNKQLKNERAAKESKNNKSFDVDSFFNAAVDRTRRDFDDLDK